MKIQLKVNHPHRLDLEPDHFEFERDTWPAPGEAFAFQIGDIAFDELRAYYVRRVIADFPDRARCMPRGSEDIIQIRAFHTAEE